MHRIRIVVTVSLKLNQWDRYSCIRYFIGTVCSIKTGLRITTPNTFEAANSSHHIAHHVQCTEFRLFFLYLFMPRRRRGSREVCRVRNADADHVRRRRGSLDKEVSTGIRTIRNGIPCADVLNLRALRGLHLLCVIANAHCGPFVIR